MEWGPLGTGGVTQRYPSSQLIRFCRIARETKEGWPLLSVETEVNGDSTRGNERCPFYWLVRWACRACTRDFALPWLFWKAQYKNIFFLTVHIFNSFVPVAQQAGQATLLGRLSLNVCVSGRSPPPLLIFLLIYSTVWRRGGWGGGGG